MRIKGLPDGGASDWDRMVDEFFDSIPTACPECGWPSAGFVAGTRHPERPGYIPPTAKPHGMSIECPVCDWWSSLTVWI